MSDHEKDPSFLRPGTAEAFLAGTAGVGRPPARQAANDDAVGDVASRILFVSEAIAPVVDSRGLGWSDVFATRVQEAPHNTIYGVTSVYWVTMPLTPSIVSRRLNGEDQEGAQNAFAINIAAPNSRKVVELGAETELLHFFLNPGLVDEIASELADRTLRDVPLRPVFNAADTELSELLGSIKRTLAAGHGGSRLKMDYLSRALCVDLLTRYAMEPIPTSGFRPMLEGLSARQIALVQDYLHCHLATDIRIDDLASLCGVSRTAFSNRFRVSKGVSPYQYVMELRLEKAKRLLGEGRMSIAEIAFACGFSDQAHFTTVFGRRTGYRPLEYRNRR
ncbi:helix-turn-helix domain-containing protein [Sphingomonas quercus]|nr:AraC family transcriptional regulator [Sphingomonas quercus]